MIKFTFLTENKTYKRNFRAEAGLSMYIEAAGKRILFDAGASDLLMENARLGGVDLETVDLAVISHGHYDHTEGLPAFCHLNKDAPVYIHKNAFRESYSEHNGRISKRSCGILWDSETKKSMKKRFIYTDGKIAISEDILVSGTVPVTPGFSPTDKFYEKCGNDYVLDEMDHEQFLVIRDSKEDGRSGIYIFSGCSHRGVVSAVQYAREIFPGEKIFGLIAGMHLCNADKEMRTKVIDKLRDELKKDDVEMIMPIHCTGMDAIAEIKAVYGEKCVIPNTGDSYEY